LIKRTFFGVVQLLGGLGAGFAILMLVVAWRLSSGPISLSYITPYIENTLNTVHPAFKFRLENTILTWAGWERTFDIRVINVRLLATGDAVIATIPEISLSLSARALAQGKIAPKSIEMFGPRLVLERQQDGTFAVAFGEPSPDSDRIAKRLIQHLLTRPDPKHAMSYLSRVEVIGADLTLSDRFSNRSWRAPMATVLLYRDASGIKGEASFDVVADGDETHIEVDGLYHNDTRRTDLRIKFGEVTPASFQGLHAQLAPLRAFNLPIEGTILLDMDAGGAIDSIGFDIEGGEGDVALPEPLKQTLLVRSMALKGRYEGQGGQLDIEQFVADFGPEGTILLPGTPPHAMPVRTLQVRGRYDDGNRRFGVDEAVVDLRGPVLRIKGSAEGIGGAATITAEGVLIGMKVGELETYWPPSWGADARRWSVAHLADGTVPETRTRVVLKTDGAGKLTVAALDGDMDIEDVTVDYLSPMPKVRKVGGRATFDRTRFDIAIHHGDVEGLSVKQGRINLTGLDQPDQYADIELLIDGPFRNAMTLIEHRPLRFASALNIDPATTGGHATTTLGLKFMLAKDLVWDQIQASAQAQIKDASIRGILLGQDLRDGQLALKADKQGIDVTGTVRFADTPARLAWRQNFGPRAPFRTRYVLTGRIDDVRTLADLGVHLKPFPDDMIEGAVGVDIGFTDFGNANRTLEVKANLQDAALRLPAFDWKKPAGVAGTVQATVKLRDAMVTEIPLIAVSAADLTVHGRARYAADGTGLETLEFDRVAAGKTDFKLTVYPRPNGGWHADLSGRSLNLEKLWDNVLTSDRDVIDKETLRRLKPSLSVTLDEVRLGPDRTVRNVKGAFQHDGERWEHVHARGEVGAAKPFEWVVRPIAGGKRSVLIRAADAGAMLKVIDFYDSMVGGTMEITGTYEDLEPGQPLIGTLSAKDYRVVNAPILARLLNVLALTGILDELRGGGVGFTTLEVPFTLRDGLLNVADARAFGSSLGFTATGRVYTHADVVDVEGTVVPAYVINSALGLVPVIGDIFTGGAKGGGVFAATYKISGVKEDPQVTVNPLTALAPGFLRNLFGIFNQVRPAERGSSEVPGESAPVQR
jgi:hypothetical protein